MCRGIIGICRLDSPAHGAIDFGLGLPNTFTGRGIFGRGSRDDKRHLRTNDFCADRIACRNFNGNAGCAFLFIFVEKRVIGYLLLKEGRPYFFGRRLQPHGARAPKL